LGESELSAVRTSLRSLLGQEVRVTEKTDPTILGGFVVRIGNMLIDMSVKTKLNGLANSALV
jgi:F0F1-type ATP synthase delta subunit